MEPNENGSMVRVTVSVRPDQKAWLDAHPQLNVSAFARDAFDAEIRRQEEERRREPEHQEPAKVEAPA